MGITMMDEVSINVRQINFNHKDIWKIEFFGFGKEKE